MMPEVQVQNPPKEYASAGCVSNISGETTALYLNVKRDAVAAVRKREGFVPLYKNLVCAPEVPRGVFFERSGTKYFEFYQTLVYENAVSQVAALAAVGMARAGTFTTRYSSASSIGRRYFAAYGENLCKRRVSSGVGTAWERVGLPTPPTPVIAPGGAGGVEAGNRMYRVRYYNSIDNIYSPPSVASNQITLVAAGAIQVTTGILAIPNDFGVPAMIDYVIIERQYSNGIGFYEIGRLTIAALIAAGGVYLDIASDTAMVIGSESLDTWRPVNSNSLLYAQGRMLYFGTALNPALCQISLPLYEEEIVDELTVGGWSSAIVGGFDIGGDIIIAKQDGFYSLYEGSNGVWETRLIHQDGVENEKCIIQVGSSLYALTTERRFIRISQDGVTYIDGARVKYESDFSSPAVTYNSKYKEVFFSFQNSVNYTTLAYSLEYDSWRKYEPVQFLHYCVDHLGESVFQVTAGRSVKFEGDYYRDGIPTDVTGFGPYFSVASDVIGAAVIPVSGAPIVYSYDSKGLPVYKISGSGTKGFVGFVVSMLGNNIVVDRNVTLYTGDVITVGVIHSMYGVTIAPAIPDRSIIKRYSVFYDTDLGSVTRKKIPPYIYFDKASNVGTPVWDYSNYHTTVPGESYRSGVASGAARMSGIFFSVMFAEYTQYSTFVVQMSFVDAEKVDARIQ